MSDQVAADLDGHVAGSGPWLLGMRWTDLLFAHWRIDAEVARALVPAPLEPDLFDGSGWLGLVPFLMSRVRPRFVPPVPPISRFPEVNIRTYARYGGRAGVWFLSLDAAGRVAVRLGRGAAGLPYHRAATAMHAEPDGWIDYRSRRIGVQGGHAELAVRYRSVGPVRAASGLERFLTQRDGLWTVAAAGRPRWLAIGHDPWPLQDAEVVLERQSLTDAAGVHLDGTPDQLAFSRRVDVIAWRPMRVAQAAEQRDG